MKFTYLNSEHWAVKFWNDDIEENTLTCTDRTVVTVIAAQASIWMAKSAPRCMEFGIYPSVRIPDPWLSAIRLMQQDTLLEILLWLFLGDVQETLQTYQGTWHNFKPCSMLTRMIFLNKISTDRILGKQLNFCSQLNKGVIFIKRWTIKTNLWRPLYLLVD